MVRTIAGMLEFFAIGFDADEMVDRVRVMGKVESCADADFEDSAVRTGDGLRTQCVERAHDRFKKSGPERRGLGFRTSAHGGAPSVGEALYICQDNTIEQSAFCVLRKNPASQCELWHTLIPYRIRTWLMEHGFQHHA